MKTKFKKSEIEEFIGISIEELFENCDKNFDDQLGTDLDDSLKSKLQISSKGDPMVSALKFAFRAGVLRGIMMTMIRNQSKKV